jgi:UDP-N-acetylmuramoyl-L-alanyl-D-glutamate--2,6-diaminopimelate ligase
VWDDAAEMSFEVVGQAPIVMIADANDLDDTLTVARVMCPAGRLICLLGCGDRDRGQRAARGALVDARADIVVLTTDNPRHEEPVAMFAEVRGGVRAARAKWTVELDRAAAIWLAIGAARAADVVVIAGRGHDQRIGDDVLPFSEVDIARSAIAARSW